MESTLNLEDLALVAILAATDAIFIPSRDPQSFAHRIICERRAAAGIPWASERVLPGLDETARKQVQRALDELAVRNWVVTIQPHATKTLAVRLTDSGDARARALVGLPQVGESLTMVERIRTLMAGDEVCEHVGQLWVPETALAGVRWGDNEHRHSFVEVEEILLPVLTRRWVVSNCSVRGHCWYTLGSVPVATPSAVPDLAARSDAARREYYTGIQAEREVLATTKPEHMREIGDIPMPVAGMRRART
jgi:hypothetical protein